MQSHWVSDDGREQWLALMTMDESRERIRRWIFSSEGGCIEQVGSWTADRATFTAAAINPGALGPMIYHFTSDGVLDMECPARLSGQTQFEVRSHSIKQPEPPRGVVILTHKPLEDPPQLATLSKLVGTWTTDTTIEKSVSNPQATFPRMPADTVSEQYAWMLNGRFLMSRMLDGDRRVIQVSLMTDEPAEESYRCWVFGSDGATSQWRVRWDESTNRFQWSTIDEAQSWSGTREVHVVDDATLESTIRVNSVQGELLSSFRTRSVKSR